MVTPNAWWAESEKIHVRVNGRRIVDLDKNVSRAIPPTKI